MLNNLHQLIDLPTNSKLTEMLEALPTPSEEVSESVSQISDVLGDIIDSKGNSPKTGRDDGIPPFNEMHTKLKPSLPNREESKSNERSLRIKNDSSRNSFSDALGNIDIDFRNEEVNNQLTITAEGPYSANSKTTIFLEERLKRKPTVEETTFAVKAANMANSPTISTESRATLQKVTESKFRLSRTIPGKEFGELCGAVKNDQDTFRYKNYEKQINEAKTKINKNNPSSTTDKVIYFLNSFDELKGTNYATTFSKDNGAILSRVEELEKMGEEAVHAGLQEIFTAMNHSEIRRLANIIHGNQEEAPSPKNRSGSDDDNSTENLYGEDYTRSIREIPVLNQSATKSIKDQLLPDVISDEDLNLSLAEMVHRIGQTLVNNPRTAEQVAKDYPESYGFLNGLDSGFARLFALNEDAVINFARSFHRGHGGNLNDIRFAFAHHNGGITEEQARELCEMISLDQEEHAEDREYTY